MLIKKPSKILFLLVFSFLACLLRGETPPLEDKIRELESLQGEAFTQAVIEIYEMLPQADYLARNIFTEKLYELTRKRKDKGHIYALCLKAVFADTLHPEFFDQAFALATKNNWKDMQWFVEERKSHYFISQFQYDSAMTYILRLRDFYDTDIGTENRLNIINMLADVYYSAGLYSQANAIYDEILNHYQQHADWDNWRPYVIMGNLGSVALKTGDPLLASTWFRQAIDTAGRYLEKDYKSNILAYNHLKLAETMFWLDQPEEAEREIQIAEAFDRKDIQEDVLQEYHHLKAMLLQQKGENEEALKHAMLLKPSDSAKYHHYRFVPEVYRLLSEIYAALGEAKLSLKFARNYYQMTDSIQAQGNQSRSMIILANQNHEIAMNSLMQAKKRFWRLLTGSVFLLVITLVILILYRKLYRSKLLLVRKSMENTIAVSVQEATENSAGGDAMNQKEQHEFINIITKLTRLLNDEKIYLDPQLSIQETARRIETNRTYLSKAINSQLNTTFPNLVNQYRIKHAIMLIANGYTLTHTQESLARESGFASSTVFIAAFKRHTGVLPSFFVKNYAKQGNQ